MFGYFSNKQTKLNSISFQFNLIRQFVCDFFGFVWSSLVLFGQFTNKLTNKINI